MIFLNIGCSEASCILLIIIFFLAISDHEWPFMEKTQAVKWHQVHPKSHYTIIAHKGVFLGIKAKDRPPPKTMQLVQVVTMKCSKLNNNLMVGPSKY